MPHFQPDGYHAAGGFGACAGSGLAPVSRAPRVLPEDISANSCCTLPLCLALLSSGAAPGFTSPPPSRRAVLSGCVSMSAHLQPVVPRFVRLRLRCAPAFLNSGNRRGLVPLPGSSLSQVPGRVDGGRRILAGVLAWSWYCSRSTRSQLSYVGPLGSRLPLYALWIAKQAMMHLVSSTNQDA